MPNDIGFDINRFRLRYRVGGIWSPNYQIFPEMQQGIEPFNTQSTPFLLPENVEDFGGGLYVQTAYEIDVHWKTMVQLLIDGQPIDSIRGPDHFEGRVGEVAGPWSEPGMGYLVVSATQAVFDPTDLPLRQPVAVRLTVSAYSDDQFTDLLPDDAPASNEVHIWVMRVPS